LHYKPLLRVLQQKLSVLRGKVLDVGCGMQPYRVFLHAELCDYTGLDREGPYARPDVIGSVEQLPFDNQTFDHVLSTQVLEHVRDPLSALRECERVLKPGGTIVFTVPGVWPAHEVPFDYWRFTRYGVRSLLEQAQFEQIAIESAGGFWASVGQLLNLELQRARLLRDLVPLVNLGAGWLDTQRTSEELALAWVATACKAALRHTAVP
jgi:SAM-dependent methyltransferase